MVIDAHQHFWHYNPVRDVWIDESMQAIRRDFLPRDLKPAYDRLGIDGSIAVQADPSEEETRFLLKLSEEADLIKAVVGWVDFHKPGLHEKLERFSRFKKLAGFRHILQTGEPSYLLQNDFQKGIEALSSFGFTYDLLLYPHHLDAATELTRTFPEQTFILDHLAKPPIRSGELEPWRKKIATLAKQKNVHCKLSGLITEADWNRWRPSDLKPFLETAFEAFGPGRLMFGSDWPVCLLAGSLEVVFQIIRTHIQDLSEVEQRAVLGENAAKVYHVVNSRI